MPPELRHHNFYRSPKAPNIKPLTLSEEYTRGEVARHWRMTITQYEALSPEEMARLRAHYDVSKMVDAYYNSEQNRHLDSLSKDK